MPYIKEERRKSFRTLIKRLAGGILNEGEMNYVVFKIMKEWIDIHGKNYKNLSSCISALENSKLEFYRRCVGPYEDEKIIENGDIK